MDETSHRVSELPPAKRALLQKLVRAQPPPTTASPPASAPPRSVPPAMRNVPHFARATESLARAAPPASLSLTFGGAPDEVKRGYQQFYDAVTAQLDSSIFGELSFFLNYGYVPTLGPQAAAVTLPEHFINQNSARLVLEVIGDCPLGGRTVLDVGCGRGGTVYVIHTFFE